MTVGQLRQALEGLAADLPVEIERYDGMGEVHELAAMHIDLRGFNEQSAAVVIVAH